MKDGERHALLLIFGEVRNIALPGAVSAVICNRKSVEGAHIGSSNVTLRSEEKR